MIRASTLTSQRRLLRNPSRRRIEPDRRLFSAVESCRGLGSLRQIFRFCVSRWCGLAAVMSCNRARSVIVACGASATALSGRGWQGLPVLRPGGLADAVHDLAFLVEP